MPQAIVTTDKEGKVRDSSTITVDNTTVPVPEAVEDGGHAAPARIGAALRDLGYRLTDDYRDTLRRYPDTNYVVVDIEKA